MDDGDNWLKLKFREKLSIILEWEILKLEKRDLGLRSRSLCGFGSENICIKGKNLKSGILWNI